MEFIITNWHCRAQSYYHDAACTVPAGSTNQAARHLL